MHARPFLVLRASLALGLWAAAAVCLRSAATARAGTLDVDCTLDFVGGNLTGQSPSGSLFPSLSADGRFVTYLQGPFPTHAYLHDRRGGAKAIVDALPDGTPFDGAVLSCVLSDDGRRAALLATATNVDALGIQVWVKDLATGALTLASVTPQGTPMTPSGSTPGLGPASISASGERVTFTAAADDLVAGKTTFWRDVFVRDLTAGATTRLLGVAGAEPDGPALGEPAISADGRFIAFASRATNLVAGDFGQVIDVFVHDLATQTTALVSTSAGGVHANGDCGDPVLSADGRFVAFTSRATNLVEDDTNGLSDVFVKDRITGRIRRVNVASDGIQADAASLRTPRIAAHGTHVLFHSTATNLAPGSSGGHLYLHDVVAGTTELVVDPTLGGIENDVADLSADGRTVALASTLPFGDEDLNRALDVYVRACLP